LSVSLKIFEQHLTSNSIIKVTTEINLFIFTDDPFDRIPVLMNVAVCPNCFGQLDALPNEIERASRSLNSYIVSIPTLYCRREDKHGSEITDDWIRAYETVGEWLETVVVKCPSYSWFLH
jgi:hypothetical protein